MFVEHIWFVVGCCWFFLNNSQQKTHNRKQPLILRGFVLRFPYFLEIFNFSVHDLTVLTVPDEKHAALTCHCHNQVCVENGLSKYWQPETWEFSYDAQHHLSNSCKIKHQYNSSMKSCSFTGKEWNSGISKSGVFSLALCPQLVPNLSVLWLLYNVWGPLKLFPSRDCCFALQGENQSRLLGLSPPLCHRSRGNLLLFFCPGIPNPRIGMEHRANSYSPALS